MSIFRGLKKADYHKIETNQDTIYYPSSGKSKTYVHSNYNSFLNTVEQAKLGNILNNVRKSLYDSSNHFFKGLKDWQSNLRKATNEFINLVIKDKNLKNEGEEKNKEKVLNLFKLTNEGYETVYSDWLQIKNILTSEEEQAGTKEQKDTKKEAEALEEYMNYFDRIANALIDFHRSYNIGVEGTYKKARKELKNLLPKQIFPNTIKAYDA